MTPGEKRTALLTHRRLAVAVLAVALVVGGAAGALAATDPYRPQQWALERIDAPRAWQVARGGGLLVAIVDSGVALEHPDLADRIARREDGSVLGRDYVDGDDDPRDENGHGTLVAGIVGAMVDNGIGIAGVAPDVRLMPVRVLDASGGGSGEDVEQAIRWAVDNGAAVVNLSLESVGERGPGIDLPIPAPTSAVEYAWSRGVIVVAASGNDAGTADDYPEDSPVVLVGATTRDDRRAEFSDAGRTDALMAPGVDIVSTWWCDAADPERFPDCEDPHTYGRASGTSFAAPHVTGALALLRSAGFSAPEAVQRLRDTARDIGAPGPDSETGHGLIDVAAAIGAREPASPPSPSPSPTPSPTASPTRSPDPTTTSAGEDPSEPAPRQTTPPPSPPQPPGTPPPPGSPDPSEPPPPSPVPLDPGPTQVPDPVTTAPSPPDDGQDVGAAPDPGGTGSGGGNGLRTVAVGLLGLTLGAHGAWLAASRRHS